MFPGCDHENRMGGRSLKGPWGVKAVALVLHWKGTKKNFSLGKPERCFQKIGGSDASVVVKGNFGKGWRMFRNGRKWGKGKKLFFWAGKGRQKKYSGDRPVWMGKRQKGGSASLNGIV